MSSLMSRNPELRLSTPSTDILPASRPIAFMMSFIVVLLPAPFSPTSPMMQPEGSVRSKLPS